jgi:hypothetical protein
MTLLQPARSFITTSHPPKLAQSDPPAMAHRCGLLDPTGGLALTRALSYCMRAVFSFTDAVI